eukprot:8323955-Ditylum_brightwellii.AAC.1
MEDQLQDNMNRLTDIMEVNKNNNNKNTANSDNKEVSMEEVEFTRAHRPKKVYGSTKGMNTSE